MSRALGPELSKMGKSEAFPNESSHSRHFWKWCRGAMRRVWGQSKWRHGLGCPNQMNEEQGVPGNDNRTRGERERESVLGNGLRACDARRKSKHLGTGTHTGSASVVAPAAVLCSAVRPDGISHGRQLL
ncbi:uncharacterized protein TrAFT101_001270 [Trichoderma asperellum]|uniref:uncharacterized protein n=1 Tax=Trichoderma asperellum TaxID=101201 RepID=UPI00332178B7|nr:hypothetical protein TrAFT101_001270 [Trichoderma asperellum]